MLFKSHIGVYDYEQLYGNNFEVDLIAVSNNISAENDDLNNTIDYDMLYRTVKEVMSKRFNLIESACKEIIDEIKKKTESKVMITIRIAKIHAPVGGELRKVWVEMEG